MHRDEAKSINVIMIYNILKALNADNSGQFAENICSGWNDM